MTLKAPVLLIDLGSIYWAAWHSSANEEVCAAHDRAVGQVRKIVEGYELVAVCCDSPNNFRKGIDPTYKANRPPRDSSAFEQMGRTKDTLTRDGLLLWECDGLEADDVLATACRAAVAAGHDVAIVSADKDLTQLVEHGVTWVSPKTGEVLDRAGVFKKFGVYPDQMRDYLAIVGDPSDNVRGVAGVGQKGAAKLLGEWMTLEQLMDATINTPAKVATPKVCAALTDALAWLPTTIKLVTLRYDAPIVFAEIYEKREVKPLPESSPMEEISDTEPAPAIEPTPEQAELYSPTPAAPEPSTAIVAASPSQLARAPAAPVDWTLALEPTTIGGAYTLAKGLFHSRLYTRFTSAEAILAIIMRGRALGLGALASLDSFNIIEGKPAPSAQLLISRAKRDPDVEYLEYVKGDATFSEWRGKTKGQDEIVLRYTIEQAQQADLLKPTASGKPSNWTKRPEEMLRKTCGVQLGRILAPGSMQGLISIDEMGAA